MALARSIAARFARWLHRVGRWLPADLTLQRLRGRSTDHEDPRHRFGREGERLAARFLRREQDFKILYRNYRAPGRGGEVDLVCRDGDTLVFVEVKTRASLAFGRPAEAVNAAKQALIIRGALAWLRLLDQPDILFRFDIAEVLVEPGTPPRFHLIENAFTLPETYRHQ